MNKFNLTAFEYRFKIKNCDFIGEGNQNCANAYIKSELFEIRFWMHLTHRHSRAGSKFPQQL